MKTLLLFSLFILLIGCKESSQKLSTIPTYKIDLDRAEELSIYDIFSEINIIPLQTPDSIVCSGIHAYTYKNNVFFWDQRQNIILNFDTLGNYRYKIDSKGRGANEYTGILNVSIDRFNDRFFILSFSGLLQYDLNGKFIQKIQYPKKLIVHSAMMVNKDTLLCVTETTNNNQSHVLNYLSLKEKQIVASYYKENPIFPINRDISYYNENLFYCIPKSPVVYNVTYSELMPVYQWDLGKYNYNYKDLIIPEFKNYQDMQKNQVPWIYKHCPWFFYIAQENKQYIYASFSLFANSNYLKEKAPEYHVFWNKKTGSPKIVKKFKESDRIFHGGSSWTDEAIYCAVEKSMIPQFIDLKALTPENQKIIEELPEDCNPVLLKYIFKKEE